MQRSFFPAAPMGLIQTVRAVHALMETDHEVCIRPADERRFVALREHFGIEYRTTTDVAPEMPIGIDHATPRTTIGTLHRPLIFPHAVPARCRELWAEPRSIRFSFAGLVTPERRIALSDWMRRWFPEQKKRLPARPSRFAAATAKIARFVRRSLPPGARQYAFGDVLLWESARGRHFPGKSWDPDYFELLGSSQFVLCPKGDYVWSYRFFESTLCGAIPVVEASCPAYEGYHFRSMDEDPKKMLWSMDDAQHNFALSVSRLTIPIADLFEEVSRLLIDDVTVSGRDS